MCQKNDYTRRVVTVLLAVVTALFVFGALQTSAQVASGGTFRLEQAVIASGGGAAADANGNVFKLESTVGEAIAGTVSTATPFSLRSGFQTAAAGAPTAGSVSVGGRVLTTGGGGLTNALVTLTDSSGASRTILTRKSGAFRFDEVNAGETYIISVNSKRYRFQPQVLSVLEDMMNLIFTAQ